MLRSVFARSPLARIPPAAVLLTSLVIVPTAASAVFQEPPEAENPLKQAQEKFRAGDFDGALTRYIGVFEAGRRNGDKKGEMAGLAGMGQCYARQYESGKAQGAYQRALEIAREISDREAEFNLLLSAGASAAWAGDTDAALRFLNAALIAARLSGDQEKVERTLNSMGLAHYQAGEFERALDHYRQAVEVGRGMEGRGHEGFVLINMGETYRRVHEFEKARGAYEEAGAFARRTQNANLEWASVRSLGALAYEDGRMEEARRAYRRALDLCREMKNRDGLAGTNVALGKVDLAEKKTREAWSRFEEARALYEESGSNLVMHPLNYMGDVHFLEGRTEQAIAFYRRSLDLAEKMSVFNYLIEMNFKIARALEAKGDAPEALTHYLRSAEHIESVRSRAGGESFRAGFLRGYIEVYERLIGLLLRRHREDRSRAFDRQAFAYAEKAKARAFLDALEEARIDLEAAREPRFRAEKLRLSRSIAQAMTALQGPGLDEGGRARLLSDLSRAEEEYDRLMERIRRAHPRFAEIQASSPPDLTLVRERLVDERTALVEFFVGEESAFAFLVTKDGFWAEDLGEASALNLAVDTYLLFLRTASVEDLRLASRGLASRLIPFARRLGGVIDRLIVVPDGCLYHLPFETLAVDRDGRGSRLLLETCSISTAPSSASLIALEARPRPTGTVFDLAGFGDPRYEKKGGRADVPADQDPLRGSYLERGFDLSPLPFSAREIRGSARHFDPGRVRLFLGGKASEAGLKRTRLTDFRILHLAVHGLIDTRAAARSALVLTREPYSGEDGFLTAREVYELNLQADLVVLSACSTARGKLERGEGVTGLSRAFFYAGARTVVASLWNVRDRSTSELMPLFYRHLNAGLTKEQALRRAKLDFLRSGSPPSNWAAFILIGEGRGRISDR